MAITVISNINKYMIKEMIENAFFKAKAERNFIKRPLVSNNEPTLKPFTKDVLRKVYFLDSDIDVTSLTMVFDLPAELRLSKFQPSKLF